MSIFGPASPLPPRGPGDIAASNPRRAVRKARAPEDARSLGEDSDSVDVRTADEAEEARRLAGAGDEESQQDRRQSGGAYRPAPRPEEPGLDLQG